MPNSVLITAALNYKLSRTDLPAGYCFYTNSEVNAVIRAAAIPTDLLNSETLHYRSTDELDLTTDEPDLIEVMVPRKIALSEWLEVAAHCLHFDRQGQPAPSLSRIARDMAVIAKAAESLRVALGLQDCDAIPPQQIRGRLSLAARREAEGISDPKIRHTSAASDQALQDAIKGIGCIARWAKDAEADILWRTKGNFAKGRKTNHAVNDWIELIGNVWRQVLDREPGTSVVVTGVDETRADGANETRADGPFVRFLLAAARPLGIELTDEAFRDRVRRIFKDKGKLGLN